MVGTRGFRLNKIKGYLKTEVLKHIEAWEHAHADVRFIYELSRASNLEAKGSVQASRIEALAIVFWAQKYKIPLEQCCDDHMLVEKMAKIIYHLKISCDKLDTILHRKIGLRWCDLFPSWLPNKDSLVKLNTLASSVAGLAAMKKRPVEEARDQLKALMTLIPQASKPTAKLIGRIVARFEAHRAEIVKADNLSFDVSELGAALDEESMDEDEDEDERMAEVGGSESQESAAQAPRLHEELPMRPA